MINFRELIYACIFNGDKFLQMDWIGLYLRKNVRNIWISVLFDINMMINCKPKYLAISLIHISEYLKYPQKKQSMEKFFVKENCEKKLFCSRWVQKISPHLNKWSMKVSNNTKKSHFSERRNYICKETNPWRWQS